MNIYKVNEDGITCAVQALRPENSIPDGWILVPPHLENKALFIDKGELTDIKPNSLVQEADLEAEAEQKIQLKMRELAIQVLKQEGELPSDYKVTASLPT
jgi:hypothetical protein